MVRLAIRCLVRSYSKTFIDKLRIYVRGGTGGNGLPSLGGVGGNGGDVYVVANQDQKFTLKNFKQLHPTKRFIGDPGVHSLKRNITGLKGANIYVQVPQGVSLIDAHTNLKIGEISKPSDKILVAKGGKGASKSTFFVPSKGRKRTIWLDLKLIADVGFVGFPNAGKSTLLRSLTRAVPKVAEYPFTTIKPELGTITYPDHRQVVLADLPGLIEGAHLNLGRGHVFLKHVERTNLLLFTIDVTGFQLGEGKEFRDAFQSVQLLMKELELYNRNLVHKSALLAVNKMDLKDTLPLFDELKFKLENWKDHVHCLPKDLIPKRQVEFQDIIPISAAKQIGTSQLRSRIREEIDDMFFEDNEKLKLEAKKDDFINIQDSAESILL